MRASLHKPILGISLALTLPFLNRALHVDDPNFLMLARHAWPHPLYLYDFQLNWGGQLERAFDILSNPPGVPWWLAVLDRLGAGREWVMHLGFVPFLVLALIGISRLETRFVTKARLSIPPSSATPDPAQAQEDAPSIWGARVTLWAATSPALLLCSHSLMPDVPLLACFALGLALTLEGFDRRARSLVLGGAVLAGCAALCRYSGVMVVPLIGLYALLNRVPWRLGGLALLAASLPGLLWSLASLVVYDQVHLLAMVGFQGASSSVGGLPHRLLYQLSALGLALAPAFGLSMLVRGVPSRASRVGALLGVLLWGLLLAGGLKKIDPELELEDFIPRLLLLGGLGVGGMVLAEAVRGTWTLLQRRKWRLPGGKDADRLFLAAWLLMVLAFNLYLRFGSVRYLLPALPAVLLLGGMALPAEGAADRASSLRLEWPYRLRLVLPLALVLTLSIGVARADYALADLYQQYVRSLPAPDRVRYFAGHWGFQHYLEAAGALAISEADRLLPASGDELLVPTYPWPQTAPDGLELAAIERVRVGVGPGWRTVHLDARACFYADVLSPGATPVILPFGFSSEPLEILTRYRVVAR